MVDTLAILISHSLILYTLFHAVKLDQRAPWFKEADEDKDAARSGDEESGRPGK